MQRSGHLSTSGVRSYERPTSSQTKSVSDTLSGAADSSTLVDRTNIQKSKPSNEVTEKNVKDETLGKENNDPTKFMKLINFQKI